MAWPMITFATVALYLLLAAGWFSHAKPGRLRLYIGFWLLCLAGMAAGPYYNQRLGGWHEPVRLAFYSLANLTPIAGALLAFRLFEDRNVSGLLFWGVALVATGIDSFDFWMSQGQNWPNDLPGILIFEYVPQLVKIGFMGLSCYALLRSWRADLVQNRFRLRYLVLAGLMLVGLEMLVVENLLGLYFVLPFHSGQFHSLWLAGLAIWLFIAAFRPRPFDWVQLRNTAGGETMEAPAKQSWLDRHKKAAELDSLLKEREIFRDAGLSLASLSAALALPEHRTRELVNGVLGYKNFNTFLNDFRVEAAARDLVDPHLAHLPILTIAMDAGYGSLAPFNKAFKERKAMTPSEYRKLRR